MIRSMHWLVFKLGEGLLGKHRWRPAASLLTAAGRLRPDHRESHARLTIALLKLERWEDAVRAASRSIAADPTVAESHEHLGIALLKCGRSEEAVDEYRRAVDLDPGRASSYRGLAVALATLGRWEDAVDAHLRAIERTGANADSFEGLGIAYAKLERWEEAADAYRRASALNGDDRTLHLNLAGALAMLERWEDATAAFRRVHAMTPDAPPDPFHALPASYAGPLYRAFAHLDRDDPDSYANFTRLVTQLPGGGEETLAAHREAVRLGPTDPARYLCLGIELSKLDRWDEAASTWERGSDFLSPQVKQRLLVPAKIARRRSRFWTPENLGPAVFEVAAWLSQLFTVPSAPGPGTPSPAAAPRLLFVLDNDYGELTTLMYLMLGQRLQRDSTLLLPPRLYAHNADIVAGRTHCYHSLDDVMNVVERERPDIAFLCSGYLFCAHEIFALETLEHLVARLRDRNIRVVTTDPFLGMLSREDPRTLVRIDVPEGHPAGSEDENSGRKRADEEKMWAYFSESERILADTYHLYPAYCGPPAPSAADSDHRNRSFFNAALLRAAACPLPGDSPGAGPAVLPHWMFILSRADYDTQVLFEGSELRFADVVAAKLGETVAAGRHPILVGPKEFIQILSVRLPTGDGIDLLSYCPFHEFVALLLSAEHAFYWNVVSHSLLIRLFNRLPIVLFDRGHLVRTAKPLFDRVVRWYYQGSEPAFRDHREPLTAETVAAWTEPYRNQAAVLSERYRRAPTPDELLRDLMAGGVRPSG